MANPEHFKIIRQGRSAWNAWVADHPYEPADLRGANLSKIRLDDGANFEGCDLREANLTAAWLPKARFGANFIPEEPNEYSNLHAAVLDDAYLVEANFEDAWLTRVSFRHSNLIQANFSDAVLSRANFNAAKLFEVNDPRPKGGAFNFGLHRRP